MHQPALILLRGLPGSGKSTLAKLLSEHGRYPVISIDDYFTDVEGNYSFNHLENHVAYHQCEQKTRIFMQEGYEKVFVDNTFTMDWEMEPYFKMAADFNYYLFVVTVENRGDHKNIHQISTEQLRKMAEKFRVVLM
jgi:predicted kinase